MNRVTCTSALDIGALVGLLELRDGRIALGAHMHVSVRNGTTFVERRVQAGDAVELDVCRPMRLLRVRGGAALTLDWASVHLAPQCDIECVGLGARIALRNCGAIYNACRVRMAVADGTVALADAGAWARVASLKLYLRGDARVSGIQGTSVDVYADKTYTGRSTIGVQFGVAPRLVHARQARGDIAFGNEDSPARVYAACGQHKCTANTAASKCTLQGAAGGPVPPAPRPVAPRPAANPMAPMPAAALPAAAPAADPDFSVTPVRADGLDDMECAVCLDASVNVVIVPCGHAVLCRDCALAFRARRASACPICAGAIASVIPLILPAKRKRQRVEPSAVDGGGGGGGGGSDKGAASVHEDAVDINVSARVGVGVGAGAIAIAIASTNVASAGATLGTAINVDADSDAGVDDAWFS